MSDPSPRSPQVRLRRTELATPGSDERKVRKAVQSGADVVFLDLEDSVAPASKVDARATVAWGLRELDWGTSTRAFRTNSIDTPWFLGDVIDVVEASIGHLDTIIVPKVMGPRDICFVDDLLTQLERRHGLVNRSIGLEVLIEEAAALACVEAIAAASPRLQSLILGMGDLAASLRARSAHIGAVDDAYPGDRWHHARSRMIVAARANGLEAIDGPFADYSDDAGLRRESIRAASLGASGKWVIHPGQIPTVHEVFSPNADEVSRAEAVIAAYDAAEAQGLGAVAFEGVMVDAASVRIFEDVLARAAAGNHAQTGNVAQAARGPGSR